MEIYNCVCVLGFLKMNSVFLTVKCDVTKCARNALCQHNKCQCRRGYIGDGVTKCQGILLSPV